MRIRTKLLASAFMPLGLLVLIGLTILYTNHLVARVEKAEHAAFEMRSKVSFLNSTINYYLLRHEENSRIQIQKIDNSLAAILSAMTSTDPYEEALVRNLRYNHGAVRNLLSRLTALWDQGDSRSPSSKELEERLTGYLLERTREMGADTIRFEAMMDAKLAAAHRKANLLIFTFAAVLSAIILIISLLTSKRISAALRRLQEGISIVSEGDLDFKVSFVRRDELGALGRAFDKMSERLKTVTVSKGRLEQEVRERKQAEEALQQSEEWFRTLAEATFEGIAITEAGRILDVNDQFAWMMGYEKKDELIGMEVASFVFSEDRPRVLENIKEGRDSTIEHRAIMKDGAVIEVEAHGKPFAYRGRSARVTALRDITNRKLAEADKERLVAELSAEKARWQATVENMLDPVTVCDAEGRATYMNRAYERLVEKPIAEDLAIDSHSDYYQIYRPDGTVFPVDELPLQKAARTGENVRDVELIQRSTGGEEFAVVFNAAPLYDEEGNVNGAVAVGRDVTELRRVERALKAILEGLESRIQERTAELQQAYDNLQAEIAQRKQAEEQLIQSRKMEGIGTLAGGIAHDFNNILAGIIGFTELALDDTPPDAPTYRPLKLVLQSAFRARDLVKQILAFSRKTQHKRETVPLSPLISETLQLLRASLPATIKITVNMGARSDTVIADPSELQQIIMNLCTNAAHAMRDTGGTLDITLVEKDIDPDSRAASGPTPGQYIELTVTDTGTGMEHEVMTRVFEPFFTTKGVGEGTGMGLSVVFGIVKSLQGDVTVESTPGTGSTFRVLLPRVSEDFSADDVGLETQGGKERILFVDDEDLLAELGKGRLEKLGYEVTAVADSTEALEVFLTEPSRFDLVVTDQTMPEMTGLDLAQRLLNIRPEIPVILCTGYSDSVSEEKALAMGIRGFLMKPLGKKELAEAVRRALDSEPEG